MLINSTELIDIGLFISDILYIERDAEEFDLSYNDNDLELFLTHQCHRFCTLNLSLTFGNTIV